MNVTQVSNVVGIVMYLDLYTYEFIVVLSIESLRIHKVAQHSKRVMYTCTKCDFKARERCQLEAHIGPMLVHGYGFAGVRCRFRIPAAHRQVSG